MSNSIEEMRCPVCGAMFSLDVLIAEEAGRAYLNELSALKEHAPPIHSYVMLFRPLKTKIATTKALRVLRETLEICGDIGRLALACERAVEQKRVQWENGETRRMFDSHNYLISILSSTPSAMVVREKPALNAPKTPDIKLSKQGLARVSLQSLKKGNEVTRSLNHDKPVLEIERQREEK